MEKQSPYAMRRVRVAYVEILGEIWMPYGARATLEKQLRDYDLENIGEFTRENVARWLDVNAGDFSRVIDFSAACGDVEIPWAEEENGFAYSDITYPAEE